MYTDALLVHLPFADPDTRYLAGTRVRRSGSARGARPIVKPVRRARWTPGRLRVDEYAHPHAPLEWLIGEVDLLLATNFLPPPTRRPDRCVLVVHDMAWETLPWSAPHHSERWRQLFERALDAGRGERALGRVRDDLGQVRRATGNVNVVYHGVDADAFRRAPPWEVEETRRRYGIDGSYVLFIGSLEPRKNVVNLVGAFEIIEHPVMLVVAGGRAPWAPDYEEQVDRAIAVLPESVRDRVVRTGYVSGEDRRALLSGAEILAYPSLQEGFGFPVLEGFAANVPVLTSRTSSIPEVAGDAAVLVDPEDPASIAAGLSQLLDDDDFRNVLRAAGTARVRRSPGSAAPARRSR